jgi:hypothetical protein
VVRDRRPHATQDAKHLEVLDRVHLVHSSHVGREKRFRVDPARLAQVAEDLTAVAGAWDARLRRIRSLAESIEAQQRRLSPG